MRPIRILHIVGGMNRGGAETWLMHVLRNIDRNRYHMDILVHREEDWAYNEEILTLGSRIIPCMKFSRPWKYARNFLRILEKYGPYDIVHSHVHHYSGFVLRLAQQAKIPVRIAHSHSDTSSIDSKANLIRRGYLYVTEKLILRHATLGLAASRKAAEALFSRNWESDQRWRILYCAIDPTHFRGA